MPADGGHTAEQVSLLVVEQGRWRIGSGVVLEANTLDLTDTALPGVSGRQVTFSQPLPTGGGTPVVLSDVQTGNSTSWVSTRQSQVTGSGFRAFLQVAKGETQPHPVAETFGWVAISRGPGPWEGGADFATGRTACVGGGGLSCTVAFGTTFAAPPVPVVSLSTLAETDAAHLRRIGLTTTSTTLELGEPLVGMADTVDHPSEQVSWLAVDPGLLAGEPLDLPPVAEDVGPVQTVAGAQPFLIFPRGSDPEGEDVSFHSYTEPTLAGPLAPVLGLAVEYFPPDEVPGGVQAVDTFTYRIRDPGGFHSHWATVTVLVDPPPVTNQPPTPAGDQVTVYEGQCAAINSSELLLNDTDPDGDALLYGGATVFPVHGQLTITGLSPLRTTYSYCPDPGYAGPDGFDYQVEDEGGLTAEATVSIAVLDDLPPTAVLPVPLCTGLTCAFDGSTSTDDLGIDAYDWSFGDGTGASGPTPIHDFPGSGTYLVVLTVTDTAGQTGTSAVELLFDSPPAAAFDVTCTGLACQFDAGASTDDLGIAGYAWSFGDGGTGSGVAPTHAYSAAGSYTVTLTVTDTAGQPATATLELTLDLPPVAAFEVSCDDLVCSFDASASTDDFGIAGYAWDFGDGATGGGEVVDHEFAEEREHTVTLTVTDGAGQTDAATAVAHPRDELVLMLVILR